jgi:hypothetical protein
MTSDWSLHHLLPPGGLSRARVDVLLGEFERIGLVPQRDATGDVVCVSGGGDGVLRFGSAQQATRWVGEHDALIPLVIEDGRELSVSAHRVDGILPVEMAGLPDVAAFDVLLVTFPASLAWSDAEVSNGPAVATLLGAALTALRPAFVYGLDEESLEATLGCQCVHRRLSRGLLPPFVGWLTVVPDQPPLAGQLEKRAGVLRRSVDRLGGYLGLRLTEEPATSSATLVGKASSAVREAEHDRGCR